MINCSKIYFLFLSDIKINPNTHSKEKFNLFRKFSGFIKVLLHRWVAQDQTFFLIIKNAFSLKHSSHERTLQRKKGNKTLPPQKKNVI